MLIDNFSYDFVEPFTGFCIKRGHSPPVSPEVIHIQPLHGWRPFTKLFQSFISGLIPLTFIRRCLAKRCEQRAAAGEAVI
ncbi:MAG TPA: hypothetical protein DDW27_04655 [Bacteroidales bacterium]|nr:hypothetical protein [Bacteroidales bacterium]